MLIYNNKIHDNNEIFYLIFLYGDGKLSVASSCFAVCVIVASVFNDVMRMVVDGMLGDRQK